jgi:hypothetical protein
MAKVRPPDLPLRLYRYCRLDRPDDIENEIDALRKRYIYCSTYKAMNDPMEGFYQPSARLKKEPEWRHSFRQIVFEAKQTVGIACFSETYVNEIMWAHYAENYKGICIAYSASKLKDNLPLSARMVRVAYADAPVRLSKHDKSDWYEAAQKVLSQKKYNWAYEREWRLLGDHPGQIQHEGDVITDVYFGSRITPNHKNQIIDGMAERGIKFHQMKVAGYHHSWSKIITPQLVSLA